jgi:hypothetical protein
VDHLFTADMIMDGDLGMLFLYDWLIPLDLRNGHGWIVRNPDAGPAPRATLSTKGSP